MRRFTKYKQVTIYGSGIAIKAPHLCFMKNKSEQVEISGTRLSLISDSLVEEIMKAVRMIKEELKRFGDLATLRVALDNLQCVGYSEVEEILKFKRTKIEELVSSGQIRRVNVDGHARFNLIQLAVDLGIPLNDLKSRLDEYE